MIRKVNIIDAHQICNIYNYYIEHTNITFEENPISVVEMSERINNTIKNLPWFVYEEKGLILGYAYASRWKSRAAYKYSVESSVYVSNIDCKKGIGTKLYKTLIDELKELNIHSIIGGVALPNDKSIGLHTKLGFKKVAEFPEVGFKFGTWIDVGYWQLNLLKK